MLCSLAKLKLLLTGFDIKRYVVTRYLANRDG